MARKSVPDTTIPTGVIPDGNNNDAKFVDDAITGSNNIVTEPEPEPEPAIIGGFESVDPSDVGNGSGSGGTGKRRGRPPGSHYGPRKTKAQTNLSGLEGILLSMHAMAAGFLEVQELALDPAEAKLLADAAVQVAAYYGSVVNPKVLAWVNLAMVCGGIYGTRFAAYRMRMKSEGANRPKLVAQPITRKDNANTNVPPPFAFTFPMADNAPHVPE